MYEILANRVGRALEPAGVHEGLLGRQDLDEAFGEGIECVGPRYMEVEGRGIILSEDIYLIKAGIDAIRNRDIYDAILAPEGYRRLCAILGEGEEPSALASSEHDGKNLRHRTTPRSRRRLRIAAITVTV
jgi:hypothetical protein